MEVVNCLFCDSNNAVQFRNRADIVKCTDCDLVYLRTRPTQEEMYQIYQAYANDTSHMRPPATADGAKTSGLRRTYFIDETIGFVQEGGVWLDVGCGWGALLDGAREKGFIPKGIEMTRICVDFATMQLQIPVSNSQFLDSRIDPSSCKVISMVHVFEHLPYPKQTLQKVFQSLEAGGIFCGIVPNIASFTSEHLQENWVWLDETHHYVHYTPQTLKAKLQEAGFVVEHIYTSVGDYDYDEVVKAVKASYLPSGPIEAIQNKVQALEKSGKGEEIRFFARKPF